MEPKHGSQIRESVQHTPPKVNLYGYKKKGKPALWVGIGKNGEPKSVPMKAFLRRKPIRQVSDRERQRREEYRKARDAYLRDCPYCEVCVEIRRLTDDGLLVRPVLREHAAQDIHHVRGRAGELLCDTRHWKAVCRWSHDWIHANPALARAIDLLAQPGQWNKQEP